MATKGRGFVLGCGDPNAKLSILFERPWEDELAFILSGPLPEVGPIRKEEIRKWREQEISRRREAYPELDEKFIVRGAPVRGMSGAELEMWVGPLIGGLKLEDCFLENTLHCAARDDKHLYPTGSERLAAEACCAHWNRLLPRRQDGSAVVGKDANGGSAYRSAESHDVGFDPLKMVSIISLHPAGLIKDTGGGIVALPLQIDSFKKAKAFIAQGFKILILAGGKAAKWWLGYGEAVTRWCGHYQAETEATCTAREGRILEGLALAEKRVTGKRTRKTKNSPAKESSSLSEQTDSTKKPRKRRSKKAVKPIDGFEHLVI